MYTLLDLVSHSFALIFFVIALYLWYTRKRESKFEGELVLNETAWQEGEVKQDGVIVTKLSFEAAVAARDKFGLLKYSVANRLIVGQYCKEYLKDKYPDLRTTDRIKHAAYATSLAFLPDPFSAQAAEFDNDWLVSSLRRSGVTLK